MALPTAVQIATQLTAAGVAPAVINQVLGGMNAPAGAPPTPPGFNRQTWIGPALASFGGAAIPAAFGAISGRLDDQSGAPGSKAILSEDLLPRLIQQERSRQIWGAITGQGPGPSAEDVYGQIREDRRSELEELGARERALKALQGQIDAALAQIQVGGNIRRAELEAGSGIKRQELASLGDIQKQRLQSGYSTAEGLLNTAIANLTAPQNLGSSSVLQQLATQLA